MSFRLFIYYCVLIGAWSAYVGWVVGRLITSNIPEGVGLYGLRAMFLGLLVALGLGLVDALWNLSSRQVGTIFLRVSVAMLIGCLGGLISGLLGGLLVKAADPLIIIAWTLAGFLIGSSIGVCEMLAAVVNQKDSSGPWKKVFNGMIGGTIGGLIGGILVLVVSLALTKFFSDKPPSLLWSPLSLAYVALGACVGLLIGLAQVFFMEAWIKVESGFRAGREKIIGKGELTIGRAESCDIGLFGDNKIERLHARILKRGNNYFLMDNNTASGTFLNGRPVTKPELLQTGDAIQVGGSVLRFGERQKRKQVQGI